MMRTGLKQKQRQTCGNSRGHSSIGRAPALQAGGCGFESHCLHFMKIGYVVLYVKDPDASFQFWTQKMGMIEKGRNQAGLFSIPRVGFAD